MAFKLRMMTTTKSLTPGELELLNWDFSEIERALDNLGATNPSDPGSPPIILRHDQLLELGDDDHPQYLHLPGRSGGQTLLHSNYLTSPLTIDARLAYPPASVFDHPAIYPGINIAVPSYNNQEDSIWPLRIAAFGIPTGDMDWLSTTDYVMIGFQTTGAGAGSTFIPTVSLANPGGNSLHLYGGGLDSWPAGGPPMVPGVPTVQSNWCQISFPSHGPVLRAPPYCNLMWLKGMISNGWDDILHSSSSQSMGFGDESYGNGNVHFMSVVAPYDTGGNIGTNVIFQRVGWWTNSFIISNRPTSKLPTPAAMFHVQNDGAIGTVLGVFKAVASQSGNLFEFRNSIGGLLSSVSANGTWVGPINPTGFLSSFKDTEFELFDDLDNTKKARFQLAGFTPNQTNTFTLPDSSGVLAVLSLAQNWTAKQTLSNIFEVDVTNGGYFQQKVFNASDSVIYLYDGAGNDYTIQMGGGSFTGNIFLSLPNSGGTVVTTSATQTLTAKTLSTSTWLRTNASGTYCRFQDGNDSSKIMLFNLFNVKPSNTIVIDITNQSGICLTDGNVVVDMETGNVVTDLETGKVVVMLAA